MSSFITGLLSYVSSLKYLSRGWMLKQLFLSGLIGLLVFATLGFVVWRGGDDLIDFFLGLIPDLNLPGWADLTLGWVSRLALLAVCVTLFKYILLLVVAPMMSQVVPKIIQEEGDNSVARKTNTFYSVGRGVSLAVSNLTKEVTLTLILLVLSLIPGLAIVTGPLIFLIQAYYLGFGNLDVYLETRMSLKESKHFIRTHRGLALGNGILMLALLLIPILGVFLAPGLGITSATLSGIKSVNNNESL